MEQTKSLTVKFSLLNHAKRIVYGVVYTPNMIDAYMGFTDSEEVERLAYRFMQLDLTRVIDTNHDNIPNGSYPVESFIARDSDVDFPAGSWVLGTKITDEEMWEDIVSGEYNSYSMEIKTHRKPYIVKLSNSPTIVGKTEDNSEHTHHYYLELDTQGRIIRGQTSEDNGHSHTVTRNSQTDVASDHTHRIVITNK